MNSRIRSNASLSGVVEEMLYDASNSDEISAGYAERAFSRVDMNRGAAFLAWNPRRTPNILVCMSCQYPVLKTR